MSLLVLLRGAWVQQGVHVPTDAGRELMVRFGAELFKFPGLVVVGKAGGLLKSFCGGISCGFSLGYVWGTFENLSVVPGGA